MNRKTITALLFAFMFSSLVAQEETVGSILQKSSTFYKGLSEYKVAISFGLHRGFESTMAVETYEGTFEKKGRFQRNQARETTVYLFPQAKIVLDENQKTMTYESFKEGAAQETPVDLTVYLQYFKKTQLINSGNEYICEMVPENNTFSQLPYGKVVLHINKDDYRINKQILFFSTPIPFTNKNGDTEQDYGRLVIDLKHRIGETITEMRLEDFITESSGQRKAADAYTAYRLIDQSKKNE